MGHSATSLLFKMKLLDYLKLEIIEAESIVLMPEKESGPDVVYLGCGLLWLISNKRTDLIDSKVSAEQGDKSYKTTDLNKLFTKKKGEESEGFKSVKDEILKIITTLFRQKKILGIIRIHFILPTSNSSLFQLGIRQNNCNLSFNDQEFSIPEIIIDIDNSNIQASGFFQQD